MNTENPEKMASVICPSAIIRIKITPKVTLNNVKTFSLKIYTSEGCEETRQVTVFNAFCGIPKGISPNNDGLNDSFDLTGLGVESISIFNRYGRQIYSKNNYLNEWYGQSDNGHELPDGTYYYLLNKSDGKQVTGWVYINRQAN